MFQVDLDQPWYYLWYCYEKCTSASTPVAPFRSGREQCHCHDPVLRRPWEQIRANRYNQPLKCHAMTKLRMMRIIARIASTGMWLYQHTQVCHIEKTKRERSDASKSQLNEASWNTRTVLKFGSKKHLMSIIIFQPFFCEFHLIARSGKRHVTISLIGCASHMIGITCRYRNFLITGALKKLRV